MTGKRQEHNRKPFIFIAKTGKRGPSKITGKLLKNNRKMTGKLQTITENNRKCQTKPGKYQENVDCWVGGMGL
jgi:hypothetical protein